MKKIIAVLLVISMLAVFTACTMGTIRVEIPGDKAVNFYNNVIGGGSSAPANGGSSAPASNNSQTTPVQTPAETQAQTEITTAPSNSSSQTPSQTQETTTAAQTPSTPSTPASSGAPSSKEEIISYYVKAYNKIGSDGGKVTRTYDYTSNYNDILNVNNNSTLQSLAKTLMNRFMVEDASAVESSYADMPPVGVTSLNITPAQVSDAKITDNGSTYTVVLKSTGTDANREADLNPGQGSAGVMGPLLRTDDVANAAKGFLTFEGLHAYYATASVTATIDKTTGHITAIEYQTPCVLHFDQVTVVLVKVQNCDIGLLFQQKYSIAY